MNSKQRRRKEAWPRMRPWVNVHVEPVAAGDAALTADMARES
jgi:hypothetical protein